MKRLKRTKSCDGCTLDSDGATGKYRPMKTASLIAFAVTLVCFTSPGGEAKPLFDGISFKGWVGDTNKTWRIKDGALVGGSLEGEKVPQNEFVRTTASYTNFVLRVKVKLLGKSGFVNGGVQVRSKPATKPPNEMIGYQADVGEGWWGALYDETRRNKVLVKPDAEAVKKAVKKDEWNEYQIRCEGKRVQTWINGTPMIDYTELDDSIEQFGQIGLQVHGGGVTEIYYKDITIEVLP
jgi:hypothetical protein